MLMGDIIANYYLWRSFRLYEVGQLGLLHTLVI